MTPRRCFWTCLIVMLTPALRAEDRPLRQIIDAEIKSVYQEQKVTPAGLADDATFLRRVYLDLVGAIPTYEEARAFLADTAADKRAKLIDRLLDDPRFGEHQADVWQNVLFGRSPGNPEAMRNLPNFRRWLAERIISSAAATSRTSEKMKSDHVLNFAYNALCGGTCLDDIELRRNDEVFLDALAAERIGTTLRHDHFFLRYCWAR